MVDIFHFMDRATGVQYPQAQNLDSFPPRCAMEIQITEPQISVFVGTVGMGMGYGYGVKALVCIHTAQLILFGKSRVDDTNLRALLILPRLFENLRRVDIAWGWQRSVKVSPCISSSKVLVSDINHNDSILYRLQLSSSLAFDDFVVVFVGSSRFDLVDRVDIDGSYFYGFSYCALGYTTSSRIMIETWKASRRRPSCTTVA